MWDGEHAAGGFEHAHSSVRTGVGAVTDECLELHQLRGAHHLKHLPQFLKRGRDDTIGGPPGHVGQVSKVAALVDNPSVPVVRPLSVLRAIRDINGCATYAAELSVVWRTLSAHHRGTQLTPSLSDSLTG
jgi:hypothetical protein